MIGGVRGGAAQQVGGTARFMGPAQYEKTVATLTKDVADLKRLLTVA